MTSIAVVGSGWGTEEAERQKVKGAKNANDIVLTDFALLLPSILDPSKLHAKMWLKRRDHHQRGRDIERSTGTMHLPLSLLRKYTVRAV